MNRMFDIRHPSLRPLWVRIAITAIALGWGTMELLNGESIWALVFILAGGWCGYQFFTNPYFTRGEDIPEEAQPGAAQQAESDPESKDKDQ